MTHCCVKVFIIVLRGRKRRKRAENVKLNSSCLRQLIDFEFCFRSKIEFAVVFNEDARDYCVVALSALIIQLQIIWGDNFIEDTAKIMFRAVVKANYQWTAKRKHFLSLRCHSNLASSFYRSLLLLGIKGEA